MIRAGIRTATRDGHMLVARSCLETVNATVESVIDAFRPAVLANIGERMGSGGRFWGEATWSEITDMIPGLDELVEIVDNPGYEPTLEEALQRGRVFLASAA